VAAERARRRGVGVVGCGEISVAHRRAYRARPDHVEPVALSDVVEATARGIAPIDAEARKAARGR
jgi:hypothetical protein